MPPTAPHRSRAHHIADQIREAIIEARFDFGEPISEESLAAAFEVSRTPVREALGQLQMQELVEVRPRAGTFVFTPTMTDITALNEYRLLLEVQAAHLAIVRNQVALARDLAPLVTRLQRAVTEEDTPAIGRLDTQVHRTIVAHADNAYLLRGYDMILPRAACLRAQLSRRLAHEPHWAFGDYENLSGYVRRGEIDRLIATLTDNSQRTGELYRQVFLDGAAPVDTEISRLRARLTGA